MKIQRVSAKLSEEGEDYIPGTLSIIEKVKTFYFLFERSPLLPMKCQLHWLGTGHFLIFFLDRKARVIQ